MVPTMPTHLPTTPDALARALVTALAAEQRHQPRPGLSSAALTGRIPPRLVTITAGRVAEVLDDELGLRLLADRLPALIAAARRTTPGVANELDPEAAADAVRQAAAAAREHQLQQLAAETAHLIPTPTEASDV